MAEKASPLMKAKVSAMQSLCMQRKSYGWGRVEVFSTLLPNQGMEEWGTHFLRRCGMLYEDFSMWQYHRERSRKKNLNKGFTTERVMEKKKSLTYFSSKTSFSHPGVWKHCVFLQLHKESTLLVDPDYSPWMPNLNFWRRELNIASSVAKCLKQKNSFTFHQVTDSHLIPLIGYI